MEERSCKEKSQEKLKYIYSIVSSQLCVDAICEENWCDRREYTFHSYSLPTCPIFRWDIFHVFYHPPIFLFSPNNKFYIGTLGLVLCPCYFFAGGITPTYHRNVRNTTMIFVYIFGSCSYHLRGVESRFIFSVIFLAILSDFSKK